MLVPSAYYPHAGGIEETTRRLALELQRNGHYPVIVTNRWPSHTSRQEMMGGLHVRRLRLELPGRRAGAVARFVAIAPGSASALAWVTSAFRPHVIHVHGAGPNAAYVAALRRGLRAPIVFSAHGEFRNDAHGVLQRSRALRWGLQTLLRHAALITAPSRVVLDELRAELDVVAPATVVPNAVDLAEFDRSSRPRDPVGPYIFSAGRLVHQKGVDIVLQAYGRARRLLAGRRLVIAGDGPESAALKRLSADLGLSDHVAFVGAVGRPRLAELMCGADMFAFPSRQEAFGIALLEAMAAGTPAVAARVGGISEFAYDGENALLIPPEDPDGLAAALVRLADDPELRRRLALGGRAQAAQHAWSRVAPLYEALYLQIAHA